MLSESALERSAVSISSSKAPRQVNDSPEGTLRDHGKQITGRYIMSVAVGQVGLRLRHKTRIDCLQALQSHVASQRKFQGNSSVETLFRRSLDYGIQG